MSILTQAHGEEVAPAQRVEVAPAQLIAAWVSSAEPHGSALHRSWGITQLGPTRRPPPPRPLGGTTHARTRLCTGATIHCRDMLAGPWPDMTQAGGPRADLDEHPA